MTDSLRTDERSWLIYDDEVIGAVVRGLEAYALSVTGQKMSRHPEQTVRAVGTMMIRIGEERGRQMLSNGSAQGVVMEWLALLGAHLAGVPHDKIKCTQALDELHGAVFHLDKRVNAAGVRGPGVHRIAVRGD